MSYYGRRRNRVRGPKPILVVEDFMNNIKQTIKPGDDVVVITTCTGRTNIARGIYVGTKNGHVSCKKLQSRPQYRLKETGEVHEDFYSRQSEAVPYPRKGIEYVDYYNGYAEAQNNYYVRLAEFQALYDVEQVPYYRSTTLQYDRIYKIDTSVFDMQI